MKKAQKAFTLIELLIVIAIIAILTVAFLPTLRGGQAGARNAARKSAVNDIVVAIERIANGDIPAGVKVDANNKLEAGGSITEVGKIPTQITAGVYGNKCLDYTAGLGADIRAILGSNPSIQSTSVKTCITTGKSGVFYKTFKSDGSVVAVAGDAATNYFVATEVEGDASKNGNVVHGAAIVIDDPGANLSAALDTWTNVLKKTTGTADSNYWVVTK